MSYDEEHSFEIHPTITVDEPKLATTLAECEEQPEVIVRLEGIISPTTLRQLAETLKYEVRVLVAAQSDTTSFLPGKGLQAPSEDTIRERQLDEYRCNAHNHPTGGVIPSPDDMIVNAKPDTTHIVFAPEGVCEWRNAPENIVDELYRFACRTEQVPWRKLQQDRAQLRVQIEQKIQANRFFKRLDDQEREQLVQEYLDLQDYKDFTSYFSKVPKAELDALIVGYSETLDPPLLKVLSWDQEEEIQQLLRGQSQLLKKSS